MGSLQETLLLPDDLDDGLSLLQFLGSARQVSLVPTPALFVLSGLAASLLAVSVVAICSRSDAVEGSPTLSTGAFFLLALTGGLDYFCTDQYQPSMPDIASEMAVAPSRIGLTIQMHQVVCGLSTLLFSPLSDYIGRRKVLLGLQLVLALGTAACACASSYGFFLLGRSFQGAAASSAGVVLAMTRDCYDREEERLKASGLLFAAMLLGPLIAPPLGGFVASRFGWRASFLILTGVAGGVFTGSVFLVRETAPAPPKISYLTAIYRTLADRHRLLLLLACGLYKSTFSILDNNNAFILETFFGLPIQQASWLVSLLAFSGASGICVSSILGMKPLEVLRWSTGLVFLAGAADLLGGLMLFIKKSLGVYTGCIFLQHFAVMIPNLAVNVAFIQDLQDIAGMASCVQMAGSFCLGSLVAVPALLSEHLGAGYMLCVLAFIVMVTQGLASYIASEKDEVEAAKVT